MKTCKVEGCERLYCAKGYCKYHWQQFKNKGYIPERGTHDPNELVIEGNICKIKLYNIKSKVIAEAIIDAEDIDKIKKKKWGMAESGHVRAKQDNKPLFLHHVILGRPPKGLIIDHKNMNPLDNRKCNLRVCNHSQNHCNSYKSWGSSSYKGVTWNKGRSKWYAHITKNYKLIHLGVFFFEVDAAKAYNEAAKKLHGEYVRLNIIG